MNWLQPLFCFILTGLITLPALATGPVDENLRLARDARAANDYKAALKYINLAIEADTAVAQLFLERAYIYYGLNQDRRADEDLKRATRVEPDFALAHLERAEFLLLKLQYTEAYYEANLGYYLAQSNLEKSRARVIRARVLRAENKPDLALLELEKGLEIDSTNLEGLRELSALHRQSNNFPLALKAIKQALRHHSTASLYAECGHLLTLSGQYEEAITFLNTALDFDPLEPLALTYRGHSYYKLEQHTLALRDLEIATQNNPLSADAWYNKALVHLALEEDKKACKCLKVSDKNGAVNELKNNIQTLLDNYCR